MAAKRVGITRVPWATRSSRAPHTRTGGRAAVSAGTTRSPRRSRTVSVGVLRVVITTRLVPRYGSGWVQGTIVRTDMVTRVGRFEWTGSHISKGSRINACIEPESRRMCVYGCRRCRHRWGRAERAEANRRNDRWHWHTGDRWCRHRRRSPPVGSLAPRCGSLGWRRRWSRWSRHRWCGDRRNGGHGSTVSNPPNKGTDGSRIRIHMGIEGPEFFIALTPLFARGKATINGTRRLGQQRCKGGKPGTRLGSEHWLEVA